MRLNRLVQRFSAEAAAIAEIEAFYQTKGTLFVPLVTLHTIGDPIVPYWHASQYGLKTLAQGTQTLHTHLPVLRYGHCNFKVEEVLAGFALLVLKSSGLPLNNQTVLQVLPNTQAQSAYLDLAKQYNLAP